MNDEDFEQVGTENHEEVSIEALDTALRAVRESELVYTSAKKISSEAHKVFDDAKMKLIGLLKQSGKKRWECEGVQGFTMYDELKFRVPQGPDNKELFFNFIRSPKVCELMGLESRDVFLKYATVNAQSLGPLCKLIKKLSAEQGEDIQLEGLLPPTSEAKLRSIAKGK